MNKSTVLSSGEWLFPIAVWNKNIRHICVTSGKRKCHLKKILDILRIASGKDIPETRSFHVERIMQYINENLGAEFSLNAVSKDLRISKFYMCHIFKDVTNITPTQYKNFLRIFNAKRLLISTDFTIQDICMKVGFGSSSYFSKCFRQLEGITPQKYRELNTTQHTDALQ